MTGDARTRRARVIIGAILRWVVFFGGPIALIVKFHGRWPSYLLLLIFLGAGLGAVKLEIDDFRKRRSGAAH